MKKWLAAISLAALCLCGAAGICEGNEISADVSTDVRTQSVPEISDETIVTSEGSAILVPMSVGETAVNWKNADGELLGEFTFRVNEENSLSVADGANNKVGPLDVLEDASGEDGEHSFGSISSLMKGIGAAVCEDCGALKLTMMPAVKTVTSDENVLRTEGPAILIPVNAGDAVVTWTNEKGETIGELAIHVDEKLALTVEKINYSCDELLDLFDLAAEIGNGHRFGEIVSVGKNICIAQYKDSNAVQLIALRNGSSKSNTSGTSGSKKPGSSKHSKPDSEDYDDQDDQDDDQDGQDDDQDGQDDDQDDDDDTCLHSFGSWSRGSESRHVRICEKCGYQQWQNHNLIMTVLPRIVIPAQYAAGQPRAITAAGNRKRISTHIPAQCAAVRRQAIISLRMQSPAAMERIGANVKSADMRRMQTAAMARQCRTMTAHTAIPVQSAAMLKRNPAVTVKLSRAAMAHTAQSALSAAIVRQNRSVSTANGCPEKMERTVQNAYFADMK